MKDPEIEKVGTVPDAVRAVLAAIGEDPDREGLSATPVRVERMLKEICSGYGKDLGQIVNGAIFSEASDSMVLIRQVEFYSLCEHHLLPFYKYDSSADRP